MADAFKDPWGNIVEGLEWGVGLTIGVTVVSLIISGVAAALGIQG